MFEHSTFIIGAYGASAVILAWCALSPVLRQRRVRTRLAQMLSRSGREGAR